jgi:hypothetical protein
MCVIHFMLLQLRAEKLAAHFQKFCGFRAIASSFCQCLLQECPFKIRHGSVEAKLQDIMPTGDQPASLGRQFQIGGQDDRSRCCHRQEGKPRSNLRKRTTRAPTHTIRPAPGSLSKVPLAAKSYYSFLDFLMSPSDIVASAADRGCSWTSFGSRSTRSLPCHSKGRIARVPDRCPAVE